MGSSRAAGWHPPSGVGKGCPGNLPRKMSSTPTPICSASDTEMRTTRGTKKAKLGPCSTTAFSCDALAMSSAMSSMLSAALFLLA